ncbi:hypothetical protein SLEP1_g52197 [Rubroshorea leprosula]|uniref:Reverse transcriptase Ty1/copia-type domain-containing protein n=1 Tax=Rubroshorea leprosula TaxID=152421 RepID=A0AAV5M777_9ROSI|nr:hypothetical protein SLEP1_g52197 [Rubroshorea leprosula]
MHVIGSKWVFKTKLKADGTLERLKARFVAKGYNQVKGVDFSETFSPVIKPAIVRIVLSIAKVKGWDIRQLNVKNAFLHGKLQKPVYMAQPPGFSDPKNPNYICHLKRALYGLKQAPRAWFNRFSEFLLTFGFFCNIADPSLFVCHNAQGTIVLFLYVDDIILTGDNSHFLNEFIPQLSLEFAMKDMGPLHYFLGVEVQNDTHGLFLCQTRYAQKVLERAEMGDCKPIRTPMAPKVKTPENNQPFHDITLFRSIVRALQYLTFTRLDITYSVNYICQFMHQPSVYHFQLVKRVLRYIKGTLDYGIRICSQSNLDLYGFSDANWASCPSTRRSTTGFCTFLDSNCIS